MQEKKMETLYDGRNILYLLFSLLVIFLFNGYVVIVSFVNSSFGFGLSGKLWQYIVTVLILIGGILGLIFFCISLLIKYKVRFDEENGEIEIIEYNILLGGEIRENINQNDILIAKLIEIKPDEFQNIVYVKTENGKRELAFNILENRRVKKLLVNLGVEIS